MASPKASYPMSLLTHLYVEHELVADTAALVKMANANKNIIGIPIVVVTDTHHQAIFMDATQLLQKNDPAKLPLYTDYLKYRQAGLADVLILICDHVGNQQFAIQMVTVGGGLRPPTQSN